jgi:hypothetical protein
MDAEACRKGYKFTSIPQWQERYGSKINALIAIVLRLLRSTNPEGRTPPVDEHGTLLDDFLDIHQLQRFGQFEHACRRIVIYHEFAAMVAVLTSVSVHCSAKSIIVIMLARSSLYTAFLSSYTTAHRLSKSERNA